MTGLTHDQWKNIHQLTVGMYDVSDINELRQSFLQDVAELIPHSKSFFDLGESESSGITFFDPVARNMTTKELSDYYELYMPSDYVSWTFVPTEQTFYRDSEIISELVKEQTEIYKKWIEPMGVNFSMGGTIVYKGIFFGSVTFFRTKSMGDFTQEELEILKALVAHLRIRFYQLYPNGFRRLESTQSNSLIAKYHLTRREHQVLLCVCEGMSNREIAASLYISENTTKKHMSSIFRKLDVSSRAQLMSLIKHSELLV